MKYPLLMIPLLLACFPALAAAGSVNSALRVTAETVPAEPHAQALEAHEHDREDQGRYRHRLFPTAAGGDEYEIRIQLTPGEPSRVALDGEFARYWQREVDAQSVLILRARHGEKHFDPARSLLNIAVHY